MRSSLKRLRTATLALGSISGSVSQPEQGAGHNRTMPCLAFEDNASVP
jgi:hypothetical protein